MKNSQVVVITGASSGIGAALAVEFAKKGARIGLLSRREDKLKKVAEKISAIGSEALVLKCDIRDRSDLDSAVLKLKSEWGKIDIVVANAGFGVAGSFSKLATQDFRNQFETNVFGLLETIYATLEEVKKSKGSFVLLGSVAGYIALPGSGPYCMSKFAVRALAESLRLELKPAGVGVTLVSPGFIESDIRRVDNHGSLHEGAKDPVPRWLILPAEKAARQIVKAVFRRKAEIIVTFHGKMIVWLKRFFPSFLNFIFLLTSLQGRSEPK